MDSFKKIAVTTSYDFGYRMFSLLESGYILLEIDLRDERVVQVTSWGYDESKNENVLYGWVVPCQSYEVLDNGKFFIEPYDAFCFGESTCYSFGFMMDEIAPSLMGVKENKTKAWYITKKNNWGVSMLGDPIGLRFCEEWAEEFGWTQEDEDD